MEENKVLATVAGVEITDVDVDAYIAAMPQNEQAYAAHPQFRTQVLNQLISLSLFAIKAEEEKLDETEEFAKTIAVAKRDILAQMEIRKLTTGVTITEEDAKAFFEANRSKFCKGETVGAKHILVASEERCMDLLGMIKSGEKTFEDAAKECSTCPSADRGGDLGEFGRGQMVPEFDKAAFEAEIGAVVGPVKTQFGYHLIQVYKKSAADEVGFDAIKEQVVNAAMRDKQNRVCTELLSDLGKKYLKQ